ncbi:MAG: hypothetical protein M0Q88_03030 [Bacilli bacterium]|nr:hypothetical protein [Bacilli bacterium]
MNHKIYRAKTKDGESVEGNLIISKNVEEGFEAIIVPVSALDSGMFTDNHVFSKINKQEYLCFETWHKVDINTVEEVNINKVVIIDSKNEYQKLAEMLGGQVANINPNSGTCINPYEIDGLEILANRGFESVADYEELYVKFKNNLQYLEVFINWQDKNGTKEELLDMINNLGL